MKNVLIITYYWPPAGGPGVQRWLKFVKYLPDFNINPIVFVPENATYPIIDKGLEKDIRKETTVLKLPIKEPYKLASILSKNSTNSISSGIIKSTRKQSFLEKVLLYVRGNFFIPDARVAWVEPSVNYLEQYLTENKIDTIITSGPPHSLHLIGLNLKERLNIQWIADFRDPWTTIGYHKELKLTKKSHQKHLFFEKKVLNEADKIITTSFTTKKEFSKITQKPIHVITNGYDVENIVKPTLDNSFTISHIGSLLSKRNPRVLWKALKELIKETEGFKSHFKLQLIGKVSQEIVDTISEFRLNDFVEVVGYVSHQEALSLQRSSQMLLMIEIDSYETIGIIPGKLFEYMAAERPILALGPEGSDVAKIIAETNTGKYFLYDEKEEIKNYITTCYNNYLNNNLKVKGIGLQYYSREKLTEKLATIL